MNELANATTAEVSVLNALAAQARMLTENIAMNMLQLGHVFTEAKRLVEHGKWAEWVQENSGMSERYAQQFMQAYARYGENSQLAALGKSKLIRLLALPEGEEKRFLEENDVNAMSTREIDDAVKAERAKWQERLSAAESARAAAERRAETLESREPEIPEAFFQTMKEKDATISEQRTALEQIADNHRELLNETQQLRAQNAALRRESDEQSDILKGMQEDLDRAQRELLDAKSEIARGDVERVPSDQLTPDVFAAAVRQFIGSCARLPHMMMTFATMNYADKRTYDELLSTIEQWAKDSRKALDTVLSEGSVV